jgi:hypothetical protein
VQQLAAYAKDLASGPHAIGCIGLQGSARGKHQPLEEKGVVQAQFNTHTHTHTHIAVIYHVNLCQAVGCSGLTKQEVSLQSEGTAVLHDYKCRGAGGPILLLLLHPLHCLVKCEFSTPYTVVAAIA